MKARHVEDGLLCRSQDDHTASGLQSVLYLTALHHFGQDKKWAISRFSAQETGNLA
jgi:hypothetical protein